MLPECLVSTNGGAFKGGWKQVKVQEASLEEACPRVVQVWANSA